MEVQACTVTSERSNPAFKENDAVSKLTRLASLLLLNKHRTPTVFPINALERIHCEFNGSGHAQKSKLWFILDTATSVSHFLMHVFPQSWASNLKAV
jgi:hypothetical protein